jgi:prepilin-type N-terminal cleavage/methylation domain-containing protein
MKKNGFALLEILIAIAISALVSTILFESFNQLNRSVQSLDNTIDEHTKATLIAWYMTKDISGAFIPPRVIQERTKKPDSAKPTSSAGQAPKEPEKKEPEIKPLTHIFYALANNEKNLQLLTCITNNPLHVYWSESTGAAKPNIVRVAYKLKPQGPVRGWKQPSFVLVRQESLNLDFNAFKEDSDHNIREYEVATGIKQLTATFLSAPPPPAPAKQTPGQAVDQNKQAPDKNKKDADKKSKPIEYKSFEQWDKEQQKSEEKEKEPEPIIPHFVNLSIVLWGNLQKTEKQFSVTIPIYPDVQYLPQKSSAQTPPATPNPASKNQPPAAGGQSGGQALAGAQSSNPGGRR